MMPKSIERSVLSSGELARLAGISADSLRHYERKKVLRRPQRAANGYRRYPAEALQRVRLIRRALAVGFTLDELATIIEVRDSGGAPCKSVRAAAAAKLASVEAQLRDLLALREELRSMLKDWDELLAQCGPGERAHLLETLASGNGNQKRRAASETRQINQIRKKENI